MRSCSPINSYPCRTTTSNTYLIRTRMQVTSPRTKIIIPAWQSLAVKASSTRKCHHKSTSIIKVNNNSSSSNSHNHIGNNKVSYRRACRQYSVTYKFLIIELLDNNSRVHCIQVSIHRSTITVSWFQRGCCRTKSSTLRVPVSRRSCPART